MDGYELDEADNLQFQGKLLWQPMDELTAVFSGTYFEISDIHDRAQRHIDDPSDDIRYLSQDTAGTFDLKTQLYSLTLTWDTAFATIKSITGHVKNDLANHLDNDRASNKGSNRFPDTHPLHNIQDVSVSTRDSKVWTQEINIVSNTDGRLDWIVGAFYMDFDKDVFFNEAVDRGTEVMYDDDGDLSEDADNLATIENGRVVSPSDQAFVVTTLANRESWSLYAQGTYHILDTVRFTGGIRYTDDTISSSVCTFFCETPQLPSQSESEVTGKAGIEWDATEELMLYFSYTRGFKPGGNNLNSRAIRVPQLTQSEKVNAFEVGAKGAFLDNRLQLFAAGFFYQYDNMQFLTADPVPFQGGVDNLPEAEVLGFEVEMKALMPGNLQFDGGLAVLDTEITKSFMTLDPVPSAAIFSVDERTALLEDVKGNPLPKAPDFSVNFALTHNADLPLGALTSRLSFTYRDAFASRVFGEENDRDKTPGHELVNLYLHLQPAAFPDWGLSFLVTNLTDTDAVNSRWTNNFGVQSTSEEFVAPRQFIGRLSYRF